MVRYSFIVVDLHHLLLASLPAHLCENVSWLPVEDEPMRRQLIGKSSVPYVANDGLSRMTLQIRNC